MIKRTLSPNARFLLVFFATLVGSFALIAFNPVNDHVIVPFTGWITRVSGAILNLLGQEVTITGTVIASSQFGVDIKNGCNGVEAMLLVLAAIFAFPATWISRVVGILAGAIAVQLLNFIRIVSLYLLGRYYPEIFQLFHTGVWQILIILAGVGIFLLWSFKFAQPRRMEASA
ncbi:MAG TPA: exosortase H [Thermoanaerobaculia bacterium]|nr:exosortase H [Thermoanaerobaculia bacterium]